MIKFNIFKISLIIYIISFEFAYSTNFSNILQTCCKKYDKARINKIGVNLSSVNI